MNCNIVRDDENWLHYVDRRCNIMRMQRGVPRAKTELLLETDHQRQKGFMYYLDENGDLAREIDRSRVG
ncbi:MAG: ATP-dependent acyl-CoA ligase [Deltaproteobacteria bacterium]|nr:ATP-dependent acyl-CoA ligase [Deltaproteobacteria bacterium]